MISPACRDQCVQAIDQCNTVLDNPYRRLGSALTARDDEPQARDLALRVLTHNLMVLAEPA